MRRTTQTMSSSIVTLASGATIGQLAILVTSPILTRIYGPDQFGEYSSVVAIAGFFSIVACGHYELGIPICFARSVALRLTIVSIILSSTSALLLLHLLPAMAAFADVGPMARIADTYAWEISVIIWASSMLTIAHCWLTRNRSYSSASLSRAAQGSAQSVFQVLAGVLSQDARTLCYGQVFGVVAALYVASMKNVVTSVREMREVWNITGLLAVSRRYSKFPIFSAPSSFINSVIGNAPVLVFLTLHSATAAGQYALAYRLLLLPSRLFAQSIAQVFIPLAVHWRSAGSIRKHIQSLLGALLAILIPGLVLLMIIAPMVFELIFGQEWRIAGNFVQLMAPWILCMVISTIISPLVSVLELQQQEFKYQLALGGGTVVAVISATVYESPYVTAALLSASGFALLAFKISWLLSEVGMGFLSQLAVFTKEISFSLPLVISGILLKDSNSSLSWGAFFVCCVFIATLFFNAKVRKVFSELAVR